jgi:hypothetical protein
MARQLLKLFALAPLLAACATEGDTGSDTRWATIDTPSGPQQIAYVEQDGLAIADGDMVLGTVEEVEAANAEAGLFSVGRRSATYRWPDGVIPYELDATYNSDQRQAIFDAMGFWTRNTQVRFRPKLSSDADWVYFQNDGHNDSFIGKKGGKQLIRVGGTGYGLIMHEIGHSIGLFHEQSRADRDSYVTIHWDNIVDGKESNFQTYVALAQDGRDLFRYDFDSVMHYRTDEFGIDGATTITRNDGQALVAQRDHLSDGDISGAMRVVTYDEGQRVYSVSSNATSRCLDVQGASYDRAAPINNYTCHGGDNQLWYWWYMPSNGAYLLINKKSGMCLDYRNLASGQRLEQRPCDGWVGQRWNLSSPTIRPVSNQSWCVQARADWTSTIEPCDGGTDQKWTFSY